jgi:hypothetical protein
LGRDRVDGREPEAIIGQLEMQPRNPAGRQRELAKVRRAVANAQCTHSHTGGRDRGRQTKRARGTREYPRYDRVIRRARGDELHTRGRRAVGLRHAAGELLGGGGLCNNEVEQQERDNASGHALQWLQIRRHGLAR